jgi:hypothetical protein
MSTQVLYNGKELTPTPFVNRSEKGIDYGSRWGYEDSINLNGRWLVSGNAQTGVISALTGIFAGQFVSFEVKDAGTSIFKYDKCILEEFSIQNDKFYPGTYINYSARIRNINVPSGVIDPSNDYSFTQNLDGTVDIEHKISAKGIVTSTDGLTNAKNFVKAFTGIGSFSGVFVSAGTPVFLSRAETIDRLNSSYSISEKYKYTSGENLSYIYTHSLTLDESKENTYKKLGLSLDIVGSSLTSNIATLRATAAAIDPLTFISSKYGISSSGSNIIVNNFSISENSGQNTIKISADFFSGIGDEYTGFFDYDVNLNWDKIGNIRSYSINGNYTSTAPIDKRNGYINTFLNTTISNKNYTGYLYNIITNSVLYTDSNFTTSYSLNPTPKSFSLNQNTGAGTLSLTASFDDQDFISGAAESSFNISTELPVHLFEFKPSANVEGVYIIQDLDSETREKVTASVDIKTESSKVSSLTPTATSIIFNNFKTTLTNTPFTLSSGVNTGIYDVKADSAFWNKTSKYPQVKTNISYSSLIKSIRPAGYKFGR